MKKIILALILIGVIGAVAFYAVSSNSPDQSANSPDTKTKTAATATASAPARISPLAPITPQSPISKTPTTVTQPSAAAKPSTPSPRAELATIIPELARLMNSQDYEILMQDFMPPEELNAMLLDLGQPGQPMALSDLANRMRQDPAMVQKMAAASQFMGYLQTQTPIFDESGQSASYPMPRAVNGKTSMEFVKIDGYWYVKDSREYFR